MRTPTAAITVVLPAVAVVVMASFLAAAGEVELALDQAGSPTCANNLASCARYMNGTSMPPDGCCEPFRHSVVKEQRCLCDLLASPEIFKAFDIKESSFHDLANRCGLKDLNTLCPGTETSENRTLTPFVAVRLDAPQIGNPFTTENRSLLWLLLRG
ncbi:hypothetical protein OsJ_34208 [Oryza sativa Japonica Group]|uniref:Bifunctional inhibitor/plant lipid transfer protein/seed storage helical domain-containing protein n=1 Tax=Oryza sativa subsp. japonica TaxID=39947 RepID=A3CC74_ORYSJ|nr:hypothetical protein OsJ_34208 [Oryza sativa Japonica Group]